MIEYKVFPNQNEVAIALTKEVFENLEQYAIYRLTKLSNGDKELLYIYDDGEIDNIAVFFQSTGNNTGFFFKRIPESTGYCYEYSAKFQYE